MKPYLKSVSVFICVFAAVFLSEGLGLKEGKLAYYGIILTLPLFLYLLDIRNGKRIRIPKTAGLVYGLFLISTIISTFFSLQIQNSLELLFFYTALFLFFIFAFNHKESLGRDFPRLLVILSFMLLLYSVFLPFFFRNGWFFLTPQTANLISPDFSHNQLGDVLVLASVFLLFQIINARNVKRNAVLFLLVIPFIILSYSRSAYFAVVFVGILMVTAFAGRGKRIKIAALLVGISFVLFLFFSFAILNESRSLPVMGSINSLLYEKFQLRDKTLVALRFDYLGQSISAFRERPLFGYGPGNFGIASKFKSGDPDSWSLTSHNIVIDHFVEEGLLGGFLFSLFLFLILKKGKRDMALFMFIALLIDLQTNALFRFNSVYLIVFILAGLVYDEGQSTNGAKPVIAASVILALFFQLIIFSHILFRLGFVRVAVTVYPLDESQNREDVTRSFANKEADAVARLYRFVRLYSGESGALYFAGNTLYRANQDERALQMYEKAYQWNPFEDGALIARIYYLKYRFRGKAEADIFFKSFIQKLTKINRTNTFRYSLLHRETVDLCSTIYPDCPYVF